MYPSKTFLSLTVKEKTFSLTVNDMNDLLINNNLIEYHPLLEQQMKNINRFKICCFDIIRLEVDHQFIVIKRDNRDNLFSCFQADSKDRCVEYIKDDSFRETYNCDYYIIDANSLTLDYSSFKTVDYDYHTGGHYNDGL